jgi:hypothetical protein
MPFPLLPLLLGGALIGGAIKGGKGQKQTSEQKSTSTTTPTINPAFQGMQGLLMQNLMGRIGQRSSLGPGFAANRISNTNQVYKNLGQNQQNRMASAGLVGSPVAEAGARTLDIARGGDIVQGLNEIPLLENQQDMQNLDAATRFMNLGMGSTTNSSGSGMQQQPGSMLGAVGGGLGDMGALLGFLFGQGALGGKKPFANPAEGIFNFRL